LDNIGRKYVSDAYDLMLALFRLCRRGLLPFMHCFFSFGEDRRIDRFAQFGKDLAIPKSVVLH
jgi:hypothetical protein